MSKFQVRWCWALAAGVTLALAGCGMAANNPTASKPAAQSTAAPYVMAGASADTGQDQWVVGQSGMAVSRNGGVSWSQLPLPPAASDLGAVSVLPSQTIALTYAPPASGSVNVVVDVDSLTTGQTSWDTKAVSLGTGLVVGRAQVVAAGSDLAGVMVTKGTSLQFSQGIWLAASDQGSKWKVDPTPVGGTVTSAGGGLWLLGGVLNQSVYFSSNGGTSWQLMDIPASIGTTLAYGPVQPDGTGVVLTATLSNSDETQVITGSNTLSGWRWANGAVLNMAEQFGPGGTPTSSVAGGVLWALDQSGIVSRVTLSSGSVTEVTAHGLPSSVTLQLSFSATSSLAAVASYSEIVCASFRKDCVQESGMITTSDGGQSWIPVADPLSS